MLFPALIIFSLQAGVYARSIDTSAILSQLINKGIREDRPVIIIVDPSNTLQLAEFRTGDYKKNDDAVYSEKFSALRNKAEKDIAEELIQALREGKCDDTASCKEVLWEAAKLTRTTVSVKKREYDD